MGATNNARGLSFAWLAYFLLTVTVVGSAVALFLYLPCRWAKEGSRLRRFGDRSLTAGSALILRLQPWLSLQVPEEAAERLRELTGSQRCLVIANHQSTLDIFLLLSLVPQLKILAKGVLRYVPLLGLIMQLSGQVLVTRGKLDSFWRAMERVRARLHGGYSVLVFPEMTRAEPGARRTLEFNAAPFLVAQQQRVPVLPVVLCGSGHAWPRGLSGVRPGSRIELRLLPALHPEQFPSAEALRDEARLCIDRALEASA